jgi:outer membrane protein assembly factor BamB
VYLLTRAGDVIIVDAASGKILNTVPMEAEAGSDIRSSIAVAYGNLFIRTDNKLYCIGK